MDKKQGGGGVGQAQAEAQAQVQTRQDRKRTRLDQLRWSARLMTVDISLDKRIKSLLEVWVKLWPSTGWA